jgi:hypothetical protein
MGFSKMKLYEIALSELDAIDDEGEDLEKYLLSQEYKLIAKGGVSKVYGKAGENTIIQITDGYDSEPKEEFVKFIKANKSPHLPKIIASKSFRNEYVVEMEKLEPISSSEKAYIKAKWKLLTLHMDTHALQDGDKVYPPIDKAELDSFTEMMIKLTEYGLKKDLEIDLRFGDNVMRRGSVLVFTDPWSGETI